MTRGPDALPDAPRLPTEHHVTIETRAFVPGADDEAWLAVNNRAFADHGEQGGWTIDTFSPAPAGAVVRPGGLPGARRPRRHGVERMAGFCWTKVHTADAGDDELGEIYVIAVDPDFHGRGLGRSSHWPDSTTSRVAASTTGMLYVDADNTAAVGLYERLGFKIHSTNAAFVADIAPAGDA